MSPNNKGDITDEEKDGEDLTKPHVTEDVAEEVEVFYPSLQSSKQEGTESNSRPAKKTQTAKKSQAYYAIANWYSTTVRRNTTTTM